MTVGESKSHGDSSELAVPQRIKGKLERKAHEPLESPTTVKAAVATIKMDMRNGEAEHKGMKMKNVRNDNLPETAVAGYVNAHVPLHVFDGDGHRLQQGRLLEELEESHVHPV